MAIWKYGSVEPDSNLDTWIKWASRQANRLDPLIMGLSSMSGNPEPSWEPGKLGDKKPDIRLLRFKFFVHTKHIKLIDIFIFL